MYTKIPQLLEPNRSTAVYILIILLLIFNVVLLADQSELWWSYRESFIVIRQIGEWTIQTNKCCPSVRFINYCLLYLIEISH